VVWLPATRTLTLRNDILKQRFSQGTQEILL
jgi:hypothetical protein